MPRSTYLEKLVTDALDNRIQDVESLNIVEEGNNISTLTNDANYQTDVEVDATVNALIDSAPGTLDTLGELATALQDNDSELAAIIAVNTSQNTAISDLQALTDLKVPRSVEARNPAESDSDYVLGHEWENSASGEVFKLLNPDGSVISLGNLYPENVTSSELININQRVNFQQYDPIAAGIDVIEKVRLRIESATNAGSIIAVVNKTGGNTSPEVEANFIASSEPQILEFDFSYAVESINVGNFFFTFMTTVTGVKVAQSPDVFPDTFTRINNIDTSPSIVIEVLSSIPAANWQSLSILDGIGVNSSAIAEIEQINTSQNTAIAEIEQVNLDQNTAIADLQTATDLKVPRSVEATDPTESDSDYVLGHEWENSSTGETFKLLEKVGGAVDTVLGNPTETGTLYSITGEGGSSFQTFSPSSDSNISVVTLDVYDVQSAGLTITLELTNDPKANDVPSVLATSSNTVSLAQQSAKQTATFTFNSEALTGGTLYGLRVVPSQEFAEVRTYRSTNHIPSGQSQFGGNYFDNDYGYQITLSSNSAPTATWINLTTLNLAGLESAIADLQAEEDYIEVNGIDAPPSATGSDSIAIGLDSSATGNNSIVIGRFSQATGISSFSAGFSSSANASNSISVGSLSTAEGENSLSLGNQAYTNGENSIALGLQSKAFALNAVQLGAGTNNTADTLQFKTITLATAQGLYTAFENPLNYAPGDSDSVDSHFQALDLSLGETQTNLPIARRDLEVEESGALNLTNEDVKTQHVIISGDSPVNLPATPLFGKHFLIINSKNSTANLTIDSLTLAPGEMYEIAFDGVEWVEL